MSHCEPSTERRRPIRLEAEPRSVRGVSYWVGADANLGRHHPSPGATSFLLGRPHVSPVGRGRAPALAGSSSSPLMGTARGEPVLGCAGIRKHFTDVDATRGNGVSSIGRDGRRQRSSYRSVAQRILGASRHSAGGTVARRGRRGFLCCHLSPLTVACLSPRWSQRYWRWPPCCSPASVRRMPRSPCSSTPTPTATRRLPAERSARPPARGTASAPVPHCAKPTARWRSPRTRLG